MFYDQLLQLFKKVSVSNLVFHLHVFLHFLVLSIYKGPKQRRKPHVFIESPFENIKLSSETLIVEIQPAVFEKNQLHYKEKSLQIALFANFRLWGFKAGSIYRNMLIESLSA